MNENRLELIREYTMRESFMRSARYSITQAQSLYMISDSIRERLTSIMNELDGFIMKDAESIRFWQTEDEGESDV